MSTGLLFYLYCCESIKTQLEKLHMHVFSYIYFGLNLAYLAELD